MAKGTISITVDDIDFWREYAKQKGFRTPALLAHVALYQYESRHPGKRPWVRTAGPLEGEK